MWRSSFCCFFVFFFFNDTATTEIYTLSYTTLFRSVIVGSCRAKGVRVRSISWIQRSASSATPEAHATRSEEHTSELQSHSDLVCRLLLEKKKTKKHNIVSSNEKETINTSAAERIDN